MGFMDLYSFTQQLVNNVTGNSAVTSAAASIMTDINSTVIRDANTGSNVGNAHGISILLPVNSGDWSTFTTPPAQYTNFQLCADTNWNEFINQFVSW